MIKALNIAQGQNKANYDIFKMFMRKIDKDPATFERRFFNGGLNQHLNYLKKNTERNMLIE